MFLGETRDFEASSEVFVVGCDEEGGCGVGCITRAYKHKKMYDNSNARTVGMSNSQKIKFIVKHSESDVQTECADLLQSQDNNNIRHLQAYPRV